MRLKATGSAAVFICAFALAVPAVADETDLAAAHSAGVSAVNRALEVNLQNCQRQKQEIAMTLSDQLAAQQDCKISKAEDTQVADQLVQCQAEGKRQRVASQTLERDLQTCVAEASADAARLASLRAEVARLKAELETAKAEVTRLQDQLRTGVGFAYGARVPSESLVRATAVKEVLGPDPRLRADQCGDALAWLAEQAGSDRAVMDRIWVWGGDGLLLCRKDSAGQPQTVAPQLPDQAHVVVFR